MINFFKMFNNTKNYSTLVKVKGDYVDFILKNKLIKLAKSLKNELIKKLNFIEV